MIARRAAFRAVIVAAVIGVGGARAGAQQSDDHPLARIKKHEQELEKKIETERDRPDKKQHAKKVVNQAEQNIRGLGEQIKGAGREVGDAAKSEDRGASHHQAATPAPKKRARSTAPSTASPPPAGGASGASATAGARGTGGALGTPSPPAR
jgi:hypothetical protein